MPIVDVEIVSAPGHDARSVRAQDLADALGGVFGTAPGRTWVRLRALPADAYAENGVEVEADGHPVFVTVLLAHPPQGDALRHEVETVTRTVAACIGVPGERVHVRYAPPAAGRQAFGGRLVD